MIYRVKSTLACGRQLAAAPGPEPAPQAAAVHPAPLALLQHIFYPILFYDILSYSIYINIYYIVLYVYYYILYYLMLYCIIFMLCYIVFYYR